MIFPTNLFKAYDIRGLVPSELTPELAHAVGRAVSDRLSEDGPVVVGRDMRNGSDELAEAVIAGLTQQGRDVWDIGLVTTDMVYFAAGHFAELAGGVMITASHNPGKFNGIKLCGHGAVPMGATNGLFDVRDKIMADDYQDRSARPGSVISRSIIDDWVGHVMTFAGFAAERDFRVAVDAGNGMGGAIFPAIEAKLPRWKVEELYFELDGTFPNHIANPHIHESLADLIKLVVDNKLDFGLAFDGDGDRGGLVDESGIPLSEAVVGAILAANAIGKNPGAAVVYDVRTSHIVHDTIVAAGGRPIRSQVGGDIIKSVMRRENAVLGIELSGHYYFRDNYFSDSGLIAVMSVIGILAASGKKLSELARPYAKYATADEQNFMVADSAAALAKLKQVFADGQQDELDGLTVTYPDWWFNVRSSNTESLLRLNVEANDQVLLAAKSASLREQIKG